VLEQSDLSSWWNIVPAPALHLPQQDTRSLSAQDQDRLAVLAFITYIQTFQEAIGKYLHVLYDTGVYYVCTYDLSDAIYEFAYLVNESLRKKSPAPVSRKLANIGGVHTLIRNIASYLGFSNLALAEYEVKPFSLAHLIDERPAGFLAPLTEAEWQALAEKAVEDMLERRQVEVCGDKNLHLYKNRHFGKKSEPYYWAGQMVYLFDNEEKTDFSLPMGVSRDNQWCHFLGAAQNYPKHADRAIAQYYPFANDEAKHAAQAIVAVEKVRCNQFLEALAGTLRFLDRLTSLPRYQEVQLPLVTANRAVLAAELIAFLTSLLDGSIPVQEETEKQEDDDEYDEEEDYTKPGAAQQRTSAQQTTALTTFTPSRQVPDRYQPTRKQQTTAEQGKSILGNKIVNGVVTNDPVKVPQASRRQGLYIIGIQRMGKSGLIENLVIQDIKQHIGVCVLDPHGELIDNIIARLPASREKDVIYLDLTDEDFFFGLNLLECAEPRTERKLTKTRSQVLHVFEKAFGVSQPATPRIYDYLFNSASTLIANPGYSLIDIPLLFDDTCRQNLLVNVSSAVVHKFWRDIKQLPKFEQAKEEREVLRRFNDLSDDPLRYIVGQSSSTINLQEIMDEEKILLIKLDRQLEQATKLIGSILIALILNASETRKTHKLFNLYADEFQNFATEDFAILLEQAGKRDIGVNMAHQNRGQLELSEVQADKNLKQRTLSVGSLVVFRCPTDADELSRQFPQKPPEPEPEWIEEEEGQKEDKRVIPYNPLDYLIKGRFIPTNKLTQEAVWRIQRGRFWTFIPTRLIDDLLIAVMERKITIGSASFERRMLDIIIGYKVLEDSFTEEYIGSGLSNKEYYEKYYGAENMPEIERLFWNAMREVIYHPEKSEQIEQEFYASCDALPVVLIRRLVTKTGRGGVVLSSYYEDWYPIVGYGAESYFEDRRRRVRYEGILFRRIPDVIALCEGVLEEPVYVPTGQQELTPKKHLHVPSRLSEQEMIVQVARLLRRLPLYTASVAITTQAGIEEYTIRTLDPKQDTNRPLFGQALADRIARIQENNRTPLTPGVLPYCRSRQEIEAEIRERQAKCSKSSEPPEEEPPDPIYRHPPR
jgi:hypothetical protein